MGNGLGKVFQNRNKKEAKRIEKSKLLDNGCIMPVSIFSHDNSAYTFTTFNHLVL